MSKFHIQEHPLLEHLESSVSLDYDNTTVNSLGKVWNS